MAQFFIFEGADLGVNRVRLGSQEGYVSAAEQGTVATSGIRIDDPDGVLDIVGWQPVVINESLCTSHPSIFRGYVATKNIGRSTTPDESLRLSDARIWDVDLVDLNAVFYFRVIHLKEGKRPAEWDYERRDWILNSQWLASTGIDDNGLVSDAEPAFLDEADYRGQYPADVLNDCVRARHGKNYFAYWDEAQGLSLFYGPMSATTMTSTLRLSNVAGDYGDTSDAATTTYAPFNTPRLERDPSGVYSGVYLQYNNGAILRQNTATASNFVRREVTVRNDRISLLSTAESWANQLLTRMANEEDRIFVSVRLPAAKVNLIREGMRLECRFQHLPDYESFTFLRVLRRTVKQTFESEAFYDLDLELVGPAIQGGSGGGPGTPPGGGGGSGPGPFVPPPQTTSIVQQKSHTNLGGGFNDGVILDNDPTVGNTLVFAATSRDPGDMDVGLPGQGWTKVIGFGTIAFPDSHSVAIWTRTVVTNDTKTFNGLTSGGWTKGNNSIRGVVYELQGTVTSGDTDSFGPVDPGGSVTFTIRTGAVTAPQGALVVGAVRIGTWDVNPGCTVAPTVTMVEDLDYAVGPHTWVGHIEPASTGSYELIGDATTAHQFEPDTTNEWSGVAAVFGEGTDSEAAPGPGQHTCEQFVGDGCTDQWTLNHPYLQNSLRGFLGGATEIALDQDDPASGVFSTAFTIATGRVLQVRYQAGAGPATGSNNTACASNTTIPPELIGSGATGTGTLVLHDDGTWGPVTNADARGIFRLTTLGGQELVATSSNTTGSYTVDLASGNYHHATLVGNTTIAFSNVPASNSRESDIEVWLRQNGAGPWGVTWPGSVTWAGGVAPSLSASSNSVTRLKLTTLDGGTSWFGYEPGSGGGNAPAEDTSVWMPLTTVVGGVPELVWDTDGTEYSLVPTLVPLTGDSP